VVDAEAGAEEIQLTSMDQKSSCFKGSGEPGEGRTVSPIGRTRAEGQLLRWAGALKEAFLYLIARGLSFGMKVILHTSFTPQRKAFLQV
jgi:hypothetical protein